MTGDEKVEIARRLEAAGVNTIEAGFPVSSPGDMAAVQRVARTVRNCEVAALARCVPGDVDTAAIAVSDAVAPVIHVFLGVSDVHLEHKLHMTRPKAVRAIRDAVSRARSHVTTVEFSPEDATRAERPWLHQCIGVAIEAGATRINIPDTVGCATPWEFGALIRDVVAFVGFDIIVSAHCHNDLGMATANSIAAVQNGATQVEVTINGIGERAGNAALEEVAVALALKGIAATSIDTTAVTDLSRYIVEITGVPVQPNRAVVGANAFSHSSGIHQDGLLKAPETYEFVPPHVVGAAGHRFVLTACSGRNAIAHQARGLGYQLSPAQIEMVYQVFVQRADQKHGAISDEELAAIIREHEADSVTV